MHTRITETARATSKETLEPGGPTEQAPAAGMAASPGDAEEADIMLFSLATDDFSNTTSTTGRLTVGGSATGVIGTSSDTDWFRIALTAGQRYQFDLLGSPTGDGTLADPYMSLRDAAGNRLIEADDGGTGNNSRFVFTATTTGNHYVSVGSNNAGTGTYRVTATSVATPQYTISAPATVSEAAQTITFTITRTGSSLPSETVYASTVKGEENGYAENINEADYKGISNFAVVFGANQQQQTITITLTDDKTPEGNETFGFIVQQTAGTRLTPFLAKRDWVIVDDDTAARTSYTLTPASTSAAEGSNLVFTITRTGERPLETLYFSTISGSAAFADGDYRMPGGAIPSNVAVPFRAGEATATVSLEILRDGKADAGQDFRAIIQKNVNDPASLFVARTAAITITEPAQSTSYSINAARTGVTEGSELVFNISRKGNLVDETIYFSTVTVRSASFATGDYAMVNGARPLDIPVRFLAGSETPTEAIRLLIREDGRPDTGEEFRGILQRRAGLDPSEALDRSGVVTILDAGRITEDEQSGLLSQIRSFFFPIALAEEKIDDLPSAFGYPFDNFDGSWFTAGDLGTPRNSGSDRWHLGEDWNRAIAGDNNADKNQKVMSIANGWVVYSFDNGINRLGETVVIEHLLPDGRLIYSLYAHLSADAGLNRWKNENINLLQTASREHAVTKGEQIGNVGKTGTDNFHLHFEIFEPMINGATPSVAEARAIVNYYLNLNAFISMNRTGWGYTSDPEAMAISSERISIGETRQVEWISTSADWPSSLGQNVTVRWHNPSMFLDSLIAKSTFIQNSDVNEAVIQLPEEESSIHISDLSGKILASARGAASAVSSFVLDGFQKLAIVASDFAAKINIGSLINTSVLNNTIYFTGGLSGDTVNAQFADRRLVASAGDGDDRLIGSSSDDELMLDAGDDRALGGAGDDLIDGGGGLDTALFGGGRLDYVISRAGGTVTVRDLRAAGEGIDTLTGIERLQFADGLMGLVPEALVLFLPGSRDLITWDATRGSDGFGYFFRLGTGSSVAAVADFTGDGRADVLLAQPGGGLIRWDPTLGGNGFAVLPAAPGFSVVGRGDLAGTGADDLLLQNAAGQLRVLDPVAGTITDLFTLASGWRVAGIGNINAAGTADILLANAASGAVIAFTDAGWRDLITLGNGWRIAGLGDVTGGLADDLVLQNSAGTTIFWDITQGSAGWRDFATLAPGWSIRGFHDLTGDGRDDVLIQNDNGSAIAWNGTGWTNLGTVLAGTELVGTGLFP